MSASGKSASLCCKLLDQLIDAPAGFVVAALRILRIDVGMGDDGQRLVDVIEDDHAVVKGEAQVGQAGDRPAAGVGSFST